MWGVFVLNVIFYFVQFTAGKESEMPPSRKSYIEYQDNMIKKLKAIARDSHEVVSIFYDWFLKNETHETSESNLLVLTLLL